MAIPEALRLATSAGIGLLLTFIGLRNAGFVADNPATLVGMGRIDHRGLHGRRSSSSSSDHRPPRARRDAATATRWPISRASSS